ncbi:predicted protein [Naegleria gruberi]|uniref:Predicted protein n=1 Tax=Naegleria gruberi TaxID=5762 RepID=D2VI93_NAEGR|nr:uncharacterized protein NAEGRDRAFT_49771 [Naegleria gruberi]EFC43556.1 predicted protein [Naegleria gruberi]|eukprot:XP_002676300.1 predicted protein [Naegleria gruberi strain NEG-M]
MSSCVLIITQSSSLHGLGDDSEVEDHLEFLTSLLKGKFSNQQKGKKKWLENRLDRMSGMVFEGFIPIEWMKETDMILNLIKNQKITPTVVIPRFIMYNRRVALELFKNRICMVDDIPGELLDDREFLLDCISLDPKILLFFDCDEDFNVEIVSRHRRAILFVSKDLIHSQSFIEKVSKVDKYLGMNLPDCNLNSETPYSLRNNKEFVLAALLLNGRALEFVSDELKNDFDVMVQALAEIYAIKHIPHCFQDLELMKQLIMKRNSVLELAPFTLIDNKEFIIELMRKDGMLIYYASHRLRMDRDVVLAAVSQNSEALTYVPNEFVVDKEILIEAANHKQNQSFLYLASDNLKSDREFVLEIVKKQGLALQYVHPSLQSDKVIVKEALASIEESFMYASSALREDTGFIVELVKEGYPSVLEYAAIDVDRDMAMSLIKINGHCLKYLQRLYPDEEMEKEAVKQNGFAFEYSDLLFEERMNHFYYGARI